MVLPLMACRVKPVEVLARGCMAMNGDVAMQGKMEMTGDLSTSIRQDNTASPLKFVQVQGDSQSSNRVAVLEIDGLILNKNLTGYGSMGENPVALLREKLSVIERDRSVQGIVLRINSPGGGVAATDMICHELRRFRAQRPIPMVACLMDTGAGGGYYAALETDHILAQPTSLVGGVGVMLNVYNLEDTLSQFNIASVAIKAGSKIDVPSPERTMTAEEKEMLQQIADSFHTRFREDVTSQRRRSIPSEQLDGRIMTGEQALKVGLIDQIGYLDDAIAWIAQRLHVSSSQLQVVMLRRDNDRAFTALDSTPNTPLQSSLIPLRLPGLDRSSLPTFLYLWQPDPSLVTAVGG